MLMRKGDVLFMNMHQKQELYRFFSFWGICFSHFGVFVFLRLRVMGHYSIIIELEFKTVIETPFLRSILTIKL